MPGAASVQTDPEARDLFRPSAQPLALQQRTPQVEWDRSGVGSQPDGFLRVVWLHLIFSLH